MPTLSTIKQTKDHKSNEEQHNLHVLYQQTGDKVTIPVLGSTKIVFNVASTSLLHTYRDTRTFAEQKILTRPQVGIRYKNPAACIQPLGIPEHRSLHHTQRRQMSTILLKSGSGSPTTGRHLSDYMGCTPPYSAFPLLFKVHHKIQVERARVILLALAWLQQIWYPYLMRMMVSLPITLLLTPHFFLQDAVQILHPNLEFLHLKA